MTENQNQPKDKFLLIAEALYLGVKKLDYSDIDIEFLAGCVNHALERQQENFQEKKLLEQHSPDRHTNPPLDQIIQWIGYEGRVIDTAESGFTLTELRTARDEGYVEFFNDHMFLTGEGLEQLKELRK